MSSVSLQKRVYRYLSEHAQYQGLHKWAMHQRHTLMVYYVMTVMQHTWVCTACAVVYKIRLTTWIGVATKWPIVYMWHFKISCLKIDIFRFKFYWNLSPGFQSRLSQYLNQWWLCLLTHTCVTWAHELYTWLSRNVMVMKTCDDTRYRVSHGRVTRSLPGWTICEIDICFALSQQTLPNKKRLPTAKKFQFFLVEHNTISWPKYC